MKAGEGREECGPTNRLDKVAGGDFVEPHGEGMLIVLG